MVLRPPGAGVRPHFLPGGSDPAAAVASSTSIGSATGSFATITGLVSEAGTNPYNNAQNVPNAFSLQLNTNLFVTRSCDSTSCRGWQQFVYDSITRQISMQYWLIGHGPNCPSDSWQYAPGPGGGCVMNSSATDVPALTLADLSTMTLTGTDDSDTSTDSVSLLLNNVIYTASGDGNILHLADRAWNVAGFDIVGDAGSSQITFNAGATLVVKIGVNDGTLEPPGCPQNAFSGESNNLVVVPPCCPSGYGASPSISFTESNAAGATSQCPAPPPTPPTLPSPNCSFATQCLTDQNQPPIYTLSCPQAEDYYQWSGTPINSTTPSIAGTSPIATGAVSNSGTTTDYLINVAACYPNTRNECSSYSIYVPVAKYCHPVGGGDGGTHPPVNCITCRKNGGECVQSGATTICRFQ